MRRARGSRSRALHHVKMNHGLRDIGVAEQQLHGPDIDSAFEQAAGTRAVVVRPEGYCRQATPKGYRSRRRRPNQHAWWGGADCQSSVVPVSSVVKTCCFSHREHRAHRGRNCRNSIFRYLRALHVLRGEEGTRRPRRTRRESRVHSERIGGVITPSLEWLLDWRRHAVGTTSCWRAQRSYAVGTTPCWRA
jgi:hypothetical protein